MCVCIYIYGVFVSLAGRSGLGPGGTAGVTATLSPAAQGCDGRPRVAGTGPYRTVEALGPKEPRHVGGPLPPAVCAAAPRGGTWSCPLVSACVAHGGSPHECLTRERHPLAWYLTMTCQAAGPPLQAPVARWVDVASLPSPTPGALKRNLYMFV